MSAILRLARCPECYRVVDITGFELKDDSIPCLGAAEYHPPVTMTIFYYEHLPNFRPDEEPAHADPLFFKDPEEIARILEEVRKSVEKMQKKDPMLPFSNRSPGCGCGKSCDCWTLRPLGSSSAAHIDFSRPLRLITDAQKREYERLAKAIFSEEDEPDEVSEPGDPNED